MNRVLLAILIIIFNSYYLNVLKLNISDSEVEIVFLDVGQGDSILIKDNDTVGLIDAGPNNNISYQIEKFLPHSKHTIDFAIATHMDKDHIEGFISILHTYKVKNFFINRANKDNNLTSELKNELLKTNTNVYEIYSDNDFSSGNLNFDILWPSKNELSKETNENSVGILIKYKEFEMFTAGDLGKDNELKAFKDFSDEQIDIDVLKVGHHGSLTSTSQELIDLIEPEVAIVSVGKNNSYHHPNPNTIELLESNSLKIIRTDQVGNIKLKTNGFSYTIL